MAAFLKVCIVLFAVTRADESGTCQSSTPSGVRGNSLLQAHAPGPTRTARIVLEMASINRTVQHGQFLKTSGSLIRWTKHPNRCLDVDAGHANSGTNIQMWECDQGNVNQKFVIPESGEGLIRWAGNQDFCLDVDAGSSADGTNIQLWRCDENNDNQKFRRHDVGVAYQIQWVKHGKCLDVDAGKTENGANLQTWGCTSNENQYFFLCREWCQADRDGGNNAGRHCSPGNMARFCGACPFCDSDSKPAGDQIEEQMARVAGAVWSLQGWTAGWKLKHSIRHFNGDDTDILGIYARGTRCAVAFQGTSTTVDWMKNLDARTASGCGFHDLHRGFWTALQSFLNDRAWKGTLEPFLKSASCRGGIHATGHSLGAAMATIFAACANSGSNPYGFRVNYLWNYAGPGVAKSQLTDGQSSDGCFSGARFWNEDGGSIDPVAGVAGTVGFVHAKVQAVQLYGWRSGGCHIYSCDSQGAERSPGFKVTYLGKFDELHDINRYYIPRIKLFFTDGRCDGRPNTNPGFPFPRLPFR